MSKKRVDSGRIETAIAAIVLLAVIALFVRFQLVDHDAPPAPNRSEPAQVSEPATGADSL